MVIWDMTKVILMLLLTIYDPMLLLDISLCFYWIASFISAYAFIWNKSALCLYEILKMASPMPLFAPMRLLGTLEYQPPQIALFCQHSYSLEFAHALYKFFVLFWKSDPSLFPHFVNLQRLLFTTRVRELFPNDEWSALPSYTGSKKARGGVPARDIYRRPGVLLFNPKIYHSISQH